jgi:hypothetical protein
MSNGNGRDEGTAGRLVLAAFGVMAFAALIGLIWTSVANIGARRQNVEQHCEHRLDWNCKSLEADIRSAVAAEGAADLAGQQLWISFIGLLGLGATVIYARGAWREAQRSADVADRVLSYVERPFLVVEVVRGDITLQPNGGARYGNIQYRFHNHGRTPAILTRHHAAIESTDGPPQVIDPLGPDGHFTPYGSIVAPGAESQIFTAHGALILMSAIRAAKEGRSPHGKETYFLGYVRYADLMAREYATGFCLAHEGDRFVLVSHHRRGRADDAYNYDLKLR